MLDLLNQMLSSMINSIVTSLQPKLQPLLGAYESVALLNFPGMTPAARFGLCIMGQVITTAITVRERQGDKKYYWLHSLLLVILNGFGGGIVAFMMIGLPPIIASNDLIIPLCVLFWYLTHYLGMCPVLSFPPIKIVWTVLTMLFRTHSVCNIVAKAAQVLQPGEFYPIPLVGPILIGTTLGSFGMFMPRILGLEKGKRFGDEVDEVTAVRDGTPWNVQGAFLTAAFYHFMVHDKAGAVGHLLRGSVGSYTEPETRIIIATMWLATGLCQVLFDANANLFHPLHKLLYLIFQVDGPKRLQKSGTVGWDYGTRIMLDRFIELLRILIVIAAISVHVYFHLPPTRIMNEDMLMQSHRPIAGSCQLPGSKFMQACNPHSLFLLPLVAGEASNVKGANYRLATWQNGHLKHDQPYTWAFDFVIKNNSPATMVRLEVKMDGTVKLSKDNEVIVSKSKCSGQSKAENPTSEKSSSMVYLTLDKSTGAPVIVCSASETVSLVF